MENPNKEPSSISVKTWISPKTIASLGNHVQDGLRGRINLPLKMKKPKDQPERHPKAAEEGLQGGVPQISCIAGSRLRARKPK